MHHLLAEDGIQCSKWVVGTDEPLILDFQMLLPSVPDWILAYSTTEMSALHRITTTMKVQGSHSVYQNFTDDICNSLTAMQCHFLEKVFFYISKPHWIDFWAPFSASNNATFWEERSLPL
jgi:hypothetical protein